MTAAALLALLVYLYVLFVLYLAYVTLWVARSNGKLSAAPLYVRATAWSVLGPLLFMDVLFNVLIGSAIFLQLPGRMWLTFTARCAWWRYKEGYRGRFARWVCDGWLNPFHDHHC